MIVRPTGDNVVIKIEKEEAVQTTKSGIFIPKSQTQQHRPDMGQVIAIGSGRVLNNGDVILPEVKEGDIIIFNKFSGTEISVGEDMFLLIKENDILAIIE
jgi:chaperonin GroES